MISYNTNVYNPYTPGAYASGFKTVDTNDPVRLQKGITKFVWSACIFRDGYRDEAHFLFSDWCVFDFDDGEYTLDNALNDFVDCIHIIGTTKSHQKIKSRKPACDRFRVLFPWERRITELRQLRYNMHRLAKVYPIDPKCVDGARYYFPCQEIVSSSAEGYSQEVRDVPESFERFPKRPPGTISVVTLIELDKPVAPGERNSKFFGMAKDLARYGKSFEEICALIQGNPTNKNKSTALSPREIQSLVRSAQKSYAREAVGNDGQGQAKDHGPRGQEAEERHGREEREEREAETR